MTDKWIFETGVLALDGIIILDATIDGSGGGGDAGKEQFIGTFIVGPVAQLAMDTSSGLRASEMYDEMMKYRDGGGSVPHRVVDRQGTYTIPDLDAVDGILIAGTTRGWKFLSAMRENAGN